CLNRTIVQPLGFIPAFSKDSLASVTCLYLSCLATTAQESNFRVQPAFWSSAALSDISCKRSFNKSPNFARPSASTQGSGRVTCLIKSAGLTYHQTSTGITNPPERSHTLQ